MTGGGGWTAEDAAPLAALSPFARVASIPGSGTLMPLDVPGALAEAIRVFWSALDGPW